MQNSKPQFVNSGTSSSFNMWSDPVRIDVIEKSDCIEFIYKEYGDNPK
jgi:hypothetical protein